MADGDGSGSGYGYGSGSGSGYGYGDGYGYGYGSGSVGFVGRPLHDWLLQESACREALEWLSQQDESDDSMYARAKSDWRKWVEDKLGTHGAEATLAELRRVSAENG